MKQKHQFKLGTTHGLTQEECANRLGISRARIYQIEQKALEKMRNALKDFPNDFPHILENL